MNAAPTDPGDGERPRRKPERDEDGGGDREEKRERHAGKGRGKGNMPGGISQGFWQQSAGPAAACGQGQEQMFGAVCCRHIALRL